jgi:hypothetical protein
MPAEYLPLLKELGFEEKATNGTPRLDFHFASAPSKWITVNGNDVNAWLEGAEPERGQLCRLRPSDPPMEGADVKSVQRTLAGAPIPVEQDGIYTPATAAAIARFQKLGIATEVPRL